MEKEKIFWESINGSVIDLTDGIHYMALPKRVGFWNIKNEFTEVDVPLQAGRKLLHVHVQERDVDLSMLVMDNSPYLLRERIRELNRLLLADKGDGHLIVEDESGARRVLFCRYQNGIEKAVEGFNYVEFVLNFRAHDPFWYAQDETSISFNSGSSDDDATWFPIFPLTLVSSSIYAEANIRNAGDIDAWPVITIDGPGQSIAIENRSSGYSIDFEAGLALVAGDKLVIDSRPGEKTAKKNDMDVFWQLTNESVLFPLVSGDNLLRVRLANANDSSQVKVIFTSGFVSP